MTPGVVAALRRGVVAGLALLALAPCWADTAQYRSWIEAMKEAPRGPFDGVRWYCNDGEVLPPEPFACDAHGGGHQHGQWSSRTRSLRAEGYRVATFLAGEDGREFLAAPDARDEVAQLLIERFLVGADDGWIFRRALFYRGAIQEEDEREGARALLTAMAGDPWWSGPAFVAWRTGARLLPHGQDSASIDRIRQESASLSDRDPGFRALRAKIHGAPDAGDADRVRAYADGLDDDGQAGAYRQLADDIDAVYAPRPLGERLQAFLDNDLPEAFDASLRPYLDIDETRDRPLPHLERIATLMVTLRYAAQGLDDPRMRLAALDLGISVENDFFTTAARLRAALPGLTRNQHAFVLNASAIAAYGTGLVNARLAGELQRQLGRIDGDATASLADYREVVAYAARAPGWGSQSLRMHFGASMQKLGGIEPLAMRFVQDQVRGSPLLLYADALDALAADAGRLAGVRHRFFGEDPGAVFTALNPGIARGVLHVAPDLGGMADFRADGIYVLPETVSDLPPVSGIITAGAGNPLSHVQLLARNLGIPNTTVSEAFLDRLREHDGRPVVLAVSPGGLVELAADGPQWDTVLGGQAEAAAMIHPDLDKLELAVTDFLPLDRLRAADSGRTVGPKAAKLGELRHHYPESVANGLAIPFGLFREVALGQPHPGGGTVQDWMARTYRELGPIDVLDEEQAAAYEAFRAELQQLIEQTPLDDAFENELFTALESVFGSSDWPGLFVRSDTNVEDLPGFTGAGLNLTVPNVTGRRELLEAIRRVWASPFTARAFAWRQAHMSRPEHVYTSILLLQSVASDKSGVLVTRDIDSGDAGVLSVAVNEGIGGAVDGQAAESLRIDRATGEVLVLDTATAPWRRVPDPAGGLRQVPASGSDRVLRPEEIRQLIDFADSLPQRFPPITDERGQPAPADVEFGFVDGRLQLFQIRPFLESRAARGSQYLAEMDAGLVAGDVRTVDLQEPPR